jgi:chemotaxis protein histidine kinase CheA
MELSGRDLVVLCVFITAYLMFVGGTLGTIYGAGWADGGQSPGGSFTFLGILAGAVVGGIVDAICVCRHTLTAVSVNQVNDEEQQALKDEKARLKAAAAAEKAQLKADEEARRLQAKQTEAAAKAAAAAEAAAATEAARLAREEAERLAAMDAATKARLEQEQAEHKRAEEEAAAAVRLEAVMAKKAEGEKLMADGCYKEASTAFADAMALPDSHLVSELPGLKEKADRLQADLDAKEREAAEVEAAAKAEGEAAAKREKVMQLVEEGKIQMEAENFYKAHKEFVQASELPDALDICPELPQLIEESAHKDREKKEEELRLIKEREKILGKLQEWKWYCGNELSPILRIHKRVPKKEKPITYRITVVRDESATFLDNFQSMFETATGPDGDGEWDPPLDSAVMQYNLKYGIKGFMAAKKLLCWIMSIHYYTATKGKECPECRLLARILGLFQPAPDHQTELILDTLAAYTNHRNKADQLSVRCISPTQYVQRMFKSRQLLYSALSAYVCCAVAYSIACRLKRSTRSSDSSLSRVRKLSLLSSTKIRSYSLTLRRSRLARKTAWLMRRSSIHSTRG